jgi:sugar O-acyltransferase (sialic acid O-acetyltransferase NeuD family)
MTSINTIVVFGTGQIAELAEFYFRHDTGLEVAAFSVDGDFVKEESFCGRPVIPFEQVENEFPPDRFGFFVALSYTKLNQLRASKVEDAKQKGYAIASYVSSRATTFAHFTAGENAFILEDNTIQPFARIGRNVTLWSGNHIGHHSVIGDHCFVSSHVVVSGGVEIGARSFIGVNATIRDNVKIGERCVVGAGCTLLEDAPDETVYGASSAERSRVPSSRLRRL